MLTRPQKLFLGPSSAAEIYLKSATIRTILTPTSETRQTPLEPGMPLPSARYRFHSHVSVYADMYENTFSVLET